MSKNLVTRGLSDLLKYTAGPRSARMASRLSSAGVIGTPESIMVAWVILGSSISEPVINWKQSAGNARLQYCQFDRMQKRQSNVRVPSVEDDAQLKTRYSI